MPGVRNERDVRFSVRVSVPVNDRLNALADQLGQSKSTAASLCLSLGLTLLEQSMPGMRLPSIIDEEQLQDRMAEQVVSTVQGVHSVR